jgi:hypothetical protein
MARAIRLDNVDWLAEPTGLAHEVAMRSSTQIRFKRVDGTGDELFGRILMRPEDINNATEEQYLAALREALNP